MRLVPDTNHKTKTLVLVPAVIAALLLVGAGTGSFSGLNNAEARGVVMKAARTLDTAQETAAQALSDGVSTDFSYAEEELDAEIDKKTESLRREYMEILDRGEGDSFHAESEAERILFEKVRAQRKKELHEEPFLILVNKWHYLPEDYTAEPVVLPNGQMIGKECYEPLMKMLEDCAAAGGNPIVCSGYRPHEKQVYLFGEQINRWLYAGYGQSDSEDLAATAVAVPGTSEHELGLAADIYSSENMSLDESQIYTFTQQWLMENCWHYGFVLRYPKDKSDITGIIFEPWHYRYVGVEHARKIQEAGICLEEYLEETDHPGEMDENSEEESGESGYSGETEETDVEDTGESGYSRENSNENFDQDSEEEEHSDSSEEGADAEDVEESEDSEEEESSGSADEDRDDDSDQDSTDEEKDQAAPYDWSIGNGSSDQAGRKNPFDWFNGTDTSDDPGNTHKSDPFNWIKRIKDSAEAE